MVDAAPPEVQIMRPEEAPNMAVYNPHFLCYKLCRVFDAGLSTVDQFARECGQSPQFIEKLARQELPIDAHTKRRIERVLSYYYRKHPELHQDARPSTKRGVEEIVLRSKDWRGFEVTDSTGKCVMYVEWPKKAVTQARIDGLWRWLDKEDPQPQLHVI